MPLPPTEAAISQPEMARSCLYIFDAIVSILINAECPRRPGTTISKRYHRQSRAVRDDNNATTNTLKGRNYTLRCADARLDRGQAYT